MFAIGKSKDSSQLLSCLLSHTGYSLVRLTGAKTIDFFECHYFSEPSPVLIANSLEANVAQYNLYGNSCHLILPPSQYQLQLMDVPQVPENEIAKTLRWQLKGLIDYPLNDIVVDAFVVPPHGPGARRKKVFTAITLQSALINKIAVLKRCLLNVTAVSISVLALKKLLSHVRITADSPCLVISFDEGLCQLYVFYEDNLYLYRTLPMSENITLPKDTAHEDLLLEIQRSIDYCLTELKFPEPKQIIFTPSFYQARDLLIFLGESLNKEVIMMELNPFFTSPPVEPEKMAQGFYAVGGALLLRRDER
jgi:MSHA biogenesis protein MshI